MKKVIGWIIVVSLLSLFLYAIVLKYGILIVIATFGVIVILAVGLYLITEG